MEECTSTDPKPLVFVAVHFKHYGCSFSYIRLQHWKQEVGHFNVGWDSFVSRKLHSFHVLICKSFQLLICILYQMLITVILMTIKIQLLPAMCL